MFDTIEQRASVVSVADVWQPPSVVAGSSFDQATRWQIGWSYFPGGTPPPPTGGDFTITKRRVRHG